MPDAGCRTATCRFNPLLFVLTNWPGHTHLTSPENRLQEPLRERRPFTDWSRFTTLRWRSAGLENKPTVFTRLRESRNEARSPQVTAISP